MNFKYWLEAVEIKKPKNKVTKRKMVKDKGTNRPTSVIEFKWTTNLNNVVKLHFQIDGENSYNVLFYVNDTLYDDAPVNQKNGRDPEILSGIFYLLKTKSDSIGANELNFRAYSSEKDERTIRNLDPDRYKQKALFELNKFKNSLNQYKVKLIPPSERRIELWQKLGKGYPQPEMDIRKDIWLKLANDIEASIKNNSRFEDLINQLKTAIGTENLKALNLDLNSLVGSLENINNAIISNSPEGWKRNKNRRQAIYKRLVDRYMSDDWNIETRNTWFYLTRKVPF